MWWVCVLSNRVTVAECVPNVADVNALLEQLNASNNFGAFVQQMRRRFRDIALASTTSSQWNLIPPLKIHCYECYRRSIMFNSWHWCIDVQRNIKWKIWKCVRRCFLCVWGVIFARCDSGALEAVVLLLHIRIAQYPKFFPGTGLEWIPNMSSTPDNAGPYLVFSAAPQFK